jgi:adenosine 3'-phospho 5'-phosphosulfate transporter B3
MVIATIINKRIFQAVEYLAAFAISLGLIIFAAVDWQISPIFHPIGLALVSMSVFADAILPNAQERLFRLGSSRLEVTVYTNFFTLIAMTITTMLSGDLVKLFQLAKTSDTNLIAYMATYICISYIAVSSFMMIVKKYGGVTAVLLSTARKGMTLILSFILFPKAFSYFYVVGAVLVLGGLLVASLVKQKKKHDVSENKLREEINQLLPNNNDIEAGEK